MTNKPIKEFRLSDISLSIWEQQHEKDGRSFVTTKIKVSKKYKDKQGDWQETNYFDHDDMATLSALANKVFEWLVWGRDQE